MRSAWTHTSICSWWPTTVQFHSEQSIYKYSVRSVRVNALLSFMSITAPFTMNQNERRRSGIIILYISILFIHCHHRRPAYCSASFLHLLPTAETEPALRFIESSRFSVGKGTEIRIIRSGKDLRDQVLIK